MEVSVIKIGNSKGIRIPSHILKECGIGDKLDLEITGGKIVLSSPETPRKNWKREFAMMHENADDRMVMENIPPEEEEWEWS